MRSYGPPPFNIAVLHGGPGAFGEVAPLAQDLTTRGFSVLELRQTRQTIAGQILELQDQLLQHARIPAVLIGWSWGAWLACLFAADNPTLVSKLVLIGAGPFRAEDAGEIQKTRRLRLSEEEQAEIAAFTNTGAPHGSPQYEHALMLMDNADGYSLIEHPLPRVDFEPEIFKSVWPEASELRRSGELLRRMQKIQCPVHAIHGDHDPHPALGVEIPLRSAIKNFHFSLLKNCGHKPWYEEHARTEFYENLQSAISQ